MQAIRRQPGSRPHFRLGRPAVPPHVMQHFLSGAKECQFLRFVQPPLHTFHNDRNRRIRRSATSISSAATRPSSSNAGGRKPPIKLRRFVTVSTPVRGRAGASVSPDPGRSCPVCRQLDALTDGDQRLQRIVVQFAGDMFALDFLPIRQAIRIGAALHLRAPECPAIPAIARRSAPISAMPPQSCSNESRFPSRICSACCEPPERTQDAEEKPQIADQQRNPAATAARQGPSS